MANSLICLLTRPGVKVEECVEAKLWSVEALRYRSKERAACLTNSKVTFMLNVKQTAMLAICADCPREFPTAARTVIPIFQLLTFRLPAPLSALINNH